MSTATATAIAIDADTNLKDVVATLAGSLMATLGNIELKTTIISHFQS